MRSRPFPSFNSTESASQSAPPRPRRHPRKRALPRTAERDLAPAKYRRPNHRKEGGVMAMMAVPIGYRRVRHVQFCGGATKGRVRGLPCAFPGRYHWYAIDKQVAAFIVTEPLGPRTSCMPRASLGRRCIRTSEHAGGPTNTDAVSLWAHPPTTRGRSRRGPIFPRGMMHPRAIGRR